MTLLLLSTVFAQAAEETGSRGIELVLPDMHELIVVRTSAAHLPLRPDAATVDEDGLEPLTVGTLEPGSPGSVRELDLRLQPGRYEVFCNMAGHYLGGMSAAFTVE